MTKKEKFLQIVKFTLFSISAGVIQIGSYELIALLMRSGFQVTEKDYQWWVYLISLTLSVLWNFTFNRKFTFKDASNVPIAMLKVLGYYLVFTPLSTWWNDALVGIGWNGTVVTVLTMLVNFVTEFIYDDLVVFKKKKEQIEDLSDQIWDNASEGPSSENFDGNAE